MVTQKTIQRIRQKIRYHKYDMTSHAMEEMAEDNLDIIDIEQAILNGRIVYIEKNDPRSLKYVIHENAVDLLTPVGIVGRFTNNDRFLIITVYQITD